MVVPSSFPPLSPAPASPDTTFRFSPPHRYWLQLEGQPGPQGRELLSHCWLYTWPFLGQSGHGTAVGAGFAVLGQVPPERDGSWPALTRDDALATNPWVRLLPSSTALSCDPPPALT